MLIRDILSLKGATIYSIEAAGTLQQAVRLMVEHDIGSLVVMENGRIAGMLTFRELLLALDRGAADFDATEIRTIMVRAPICGSPNDTLGELREMMTRHHIRYLPVKEADDLVGVVSFHDVANALIKETNLENRLLKRYIESEPPDASPEL